MTTNRKNHLVLLTPARPERIPEDRLPRIPAWWPVPDPKNPLTEQERAEARDAQARKEASSGPYDGQRMQTPADGPPPESMTPLGQGNVRYVIDNAVSKPGRLVYRYDTGCPIHAELMRAVEQAYDENGPEYITTARDETKERP